MGRDRKPINAKVWLVATLTLALVTPGCSPGSDERSDVEMVVRAYAQALTPALAAETLEPLRSCATPEQVDRVRLQVLELLNEDEVQVEARVVSQSIESVEVANDNASVVVSEEWAYAQRDATSGEVVFQEDYHSEVVYTLVRSTDDGLWLVSEVESH